MSLVRAKQLASDVLTTDASKPAPTDDYTALGKQIADVADPTDDLDAVNLRTLQAEQLATIRNLTTLVNQVLLEVVDEVKRMRFMISRMTDLDPEPGDVDMGS